MDWRIKAFIQKKLSASRLGDKMNHGLITLNKNYNKNIVIYQSHEALRKFAHTKLNFEKPLTALEIGTGYSLISAITLALLGFDKVITADVTPDITFSSFKKQRKYLRDEIFLKQILEYSKYSLSELETKIDQINDVSTFDSLFEILNIKYIAPYQFEDVEKETHQLDYIASQVVLEHVTPEILNLLFKKTKQWLSSDGYSVHTINFIDHFANPGLFQDKSISEFNFLKYSDEYWEFWSGNSIAYTNRLSYVYYWELCVKYEIGIIDFLGENYRKRVELKSSLIHEDVIRKYRTIVDLDELTRFQRGTFILKISNKATAVNSA